MSDFLPSGEYFDFILKFEKEHSCVGLFFTSPEAAKANIKSLLLGNSLCVVFDLDGTLISGSPLSNDIKVRHHARELIKHLHDNGIVIIIWSAGRYDHVAKSLLYLGILDCISTVICRGDCYNDWSTASGATKNLNRIREKNIVLIDDTPGVASVTNGSTLIIPSYSYGPDTVLIELKSLLLFVNHCVCHPKIIGSSEELADSNTCLYYLDCLRPLLYCEGTKMHSFSYYYFDRKFFPFLCDPLDANKKEIRLVNEYTYKAPSCQFAITVQPVVAIINSDDDECFWGKLIILPTPVVIEDDYD